MLVQPPSTASTITDVVSRIIISEMPSMPIVKLMPHVGIHGTLTMACHPAAAGSNDHQRPSDTTNSTTNVPSAIKRGAAAVPDATSSPPGAPPGSPCSQIATAPAAGTASSAGRTQCM